MIFYWKNNLGEENFITLSSFKWNICFSKHSFLQSGRESIWMMRLAKQDFFQHSWLHQVILRKFRQIFMEKGNSARFQFTDEIFFIEFLPSLFLVIIQHEIWGSVFSNYIFAEHGQSLKAKTSLRENATEATIASINETGEVESTLFNHSCYYQTAPGCSVLGKRKCIIFQMCAE